LVNNIPYTFSDFDSRDLKIALGGTDITLEQELGGYGFVLINIFKYRNSPIVRTLTPTYPILIKGEIRGEVSVAKILLELINTPRDRIPLIMYQERYTPFFSIIKNILENGEIKHEGPEPLAIISLLY